MGPAGMDFEDRDPERRDDAVAGLSRPQVVTLVGAAVTAVGAFLPWVTASYGLGTITVHGTETQGGITLVLAVFIAVAVLLFWTHRGQVAVALMGLVVAAIGVLYVVDPSRGIDVRIGGIDVAALATSPEVGLYVTAAGGILVLGGALLALRR